VRVSLCRFDALVTHDDPELLDRSSPEDPMRREGMPCRLVPGQGGQPALLDRRGEVAMTRCIPCTHAAPSVPA
jgi:hypothetical protein